MSTNRPPSPKDGCGHTIRPSDTVVWDWSTSSKTVRLKPMGPAFGLFDLTDGIRKPARHGSQWSAVIRYDADRANTEKDITDWPWDEDQPTGFPGLDAGAAVWTLTTRGRSNGSTRHRRCLTMTEAQDVALAWLDRRFSAYDRTEVHA
jgi:hypothetical protein